MKRILVLGAYGYHNNQLDGQTVKTRQVYELLKEKYDGKVEWFCTSKMRKRPWLLLQLFCQIVACQTIIALYSSSGGFQTFVPYLFKLSKFLGIRFIYIAIGSGQVDCMEGRGIYSKRKENLIELCRQMAGFLVETKFVKDELISLYGYTNVDLFPNFRYFDKNIKFSPTTGKTLKLVFMARITPQKGYDTIFEFFKSIRGKGYDISMDFYGPMDGKCNSEFLSLVDKYKDCRVCYKGILRPNEIYMTLTKYDILLFPTLVDGIPGTIIDAYISSLAIVATNWVYAKEIIDDSVNGFIVPYDNPEKQEEFNKRLIQLYNDRDLLCQMKYAAFETREKFSPEAAWMVLKKYI